MLTSLNRYFYCPRYYFRVLTALIFPILLFPVITWAQPAECDSTMSFDLLLAPPAPGFVLLGIEPASVERPGAVTDLAVTILNQTDNLSVLPENFALEFAPYWLFAERGITYEKYANHKNIKSNFLQTLSFSVATAFNSETSPDSPSASIALGIRFSLLRGKIDSEFNDYADSLDTLYKELDELNKKFEPEQRRRIKKDETIRKLEDEFLNADAAIQPTIKPLIEAQVAQRKAEIKQQVEAEVREQHAENIESIKGLISRLRLRRIGWKLDVAGGAVADFPQRVFDDGSFSRWGAWLTGGYEWRKWIALGVFRFLGNYDDSDQSNFDLGGRLIFDNFKKFSLSAEGVYRNLPNSSTDDNQWRLALIFDYAIAKNKSISFTVGRDFEGKQSGNLISLVNLLLGFGSNRPFR